MPAPDRTTSPAADLPVFGNLDPSLSHAWHPVALSRELRQGGWLQVRLAGRTWPVRRTEEGLVSEPSAFDVGERYGVVWLAPEEPTGRLLHVPEIADRHFVVGHLTPVRAAGPAGALAETLLDEAAYGASGTGADIPAPRVREEAGGFTAVSEPHPGDPYRTTTVVRAPFQLSRRVEDPATGAVTTVVVVLQPEDADSTRAYGCVLLSAGPGRRLPAPATVAAAVAVEQRTLAGHAGHAGLQVAPRSPGLLQVPAPADGLGVALRRLLADFARTGVLAA